MPETKSLRIQGKPASIAGIRRSPRFIHPNQPSDSETPNSESNLDLALNSSQKSSFDKSRKLRRSKASEVKETDSSSRSVTESARGKRRSTRQYVAGESCCVRRSPRFSIVKSLDWEKFKQADCPVSKLDGQRSSSSCIRRDAGSDNRSRKCRKKVSERSESDDLVAVSMVKELSTALNTPKNCSNTSGKRVTRSTTCATARKDNKILNDVGEIYPDIVIGIMADPIKNVDKKEVATQVDKKLVGSKRKFTSAVNVRPSVQERTTGLELKNINTAEKQPMVHGWTREQELALKEAYFQAKPTPRYWKKVAKMVPGKSAQECYDKINSDILTPPQPQRRSGSKRTSSLSFSLSPSILLTPSEPASKKPKRGKGKQCSYKNVRQLLNKQAKTEQKSGKDLFSVLEPSFDLSTHSIQNVEVVSKGERSSLARINDKSGHRDQLRGSLNSPPVLKQIKNKALHEKYIDQLHVRDAKRNVAAKRATQCAKGKNLAKESQVVKEDVIGKATSSLIVTARSAINEFLQLQSNVTAESDDGNDDFDDRDEDEMENSL